MAVTGTGVNDAPVRTAPATMPALTVLEDAAATTLPLSGLVYATGPANESGQALTYTVTQLPAAALGTMYLANGTTAVLANGTSTLAEIQGMKFKPAADANGTGVFAFVVKDDGGTADGGLDSLAQTVAITVTAVNDVPVLTSGSVGNLSVAEDSGVTSLVLSGVAYAAGRATAADELASQTLTYTVTAIPAAALGTVELADGTAVTAGTVYTLAQLQGMRFRTAPNAFGSGTFTYTVTDSGDTANGGVNTLTQTISITVTAVNDAPVVTTSGGAAAFTEGGGAVVVDAGLTVTDVDSPNLASATVSITGNFVAAEDTLGFVNQGGITGAYNAATGVLTLTGPATVSAYQAALRTVTYGNTSQNPSTAARTVTFTVTDDGTPSPATSSPAARAVTVAAVNTAPTVAVTDTTPLAYTEGNGAKVIDTLTPALAVGDVDSPTLTGATVAITTGFAAGQDVLSIPAASVPAGVTVSYDPAAGVLTLTGSASVAAYQTALRDVLYTHTS
jgi:hypothetical protein